MAPMMPIIAMAISNSRRLNPKFFFYSLIKNSSTKSSPAFVVSPSDLPMAVVSFNPPLIPVLLAIDMYPQPVEAVAGVPAVDDAAGVKVFLNLSAK